MSETLLTYDKVDELLQAAPDYSLGEDDRGNLCIRIDTGKFMETTYSYGHLSRTPSPTEEGRVLLEFDLVVHQFCSNGVLKDPEMFPADITEFKGSVAAPVLMHIYESLKASEQEPEQEATPQIIL